MLKDVCMGHPHATLFNSETGHSGGDVAEPGRDGPGEDSAPTSTIRSNDHGDDTSRDDHVFERHHAILVRAQSLHCFDVGLHHIRVSFFEPKGADSNPVACACCRRGPSTTRAAISPYAGRYTDADLTVKLAGPPSTGLLETRAWERTTERPCT